MTIFGTNKSYFNISPLSYFSFLHQIFYFVARFLSPSAFVSTFVLVMTKSKKSKSKSKSDKSDKKPKSAANSHGSSHHDKKKSTSSHHDDKVSWIELIIFSINNFIFFFLQSHKSKKSHSDKASKTSTTSGSGNKPTDISTSVIGDSKKPITATGNAKTKGGKPINGNSYEPSNVIGRPKLCMQMAKVLATGGAVKLKSLKELKDKGYELHSKAISSQVSLKKASGPHDKTMACKVIVLKECTPRYKITMDKYSLRIMKFLGKKPLTNCIPKLYDIFEVSDKINKSQLNQI